MMDREQLRRTRRRSAEKTGADGEADAHPGAAVPDNTSGEEEAAGKAGGKKRAGKRSRQLRIWWWLLRNVILLIVFFAALVGGLYVGYVKLGGLPAEDVWKPGTWQHMYDLIFSDS